MTVIWPDWNRLVQEGNAKAIGIPWTDEEWKILEAIQDEEEKKQVVEELRNWTYKKEPEDKFKNITKKVLEEALAKANISTEGVTKKDDLVKLYEESGLPFEELVKAE